MSVFRRARLWIHCRRVNARFQVLRQLVLDDHASCDDPALTCHTSAEKALFNAQYVAWVRGTGRYE